MKKPYWKIFVIIILPVSLFAYGKLSAENIFDVRVSDDFTESEQTNPRVAVGYSGEIAVVWSDKRNSFQAIYYQYLDSTGTALGLNKKISGLSLTAPQFDPSLNANLMGQFGAVWRDFRNGSYPFRPDIYYARMDTSGAGLNHSVTEPRFDSTCQSPDIAVLPNGYRIIVWADYRHGNWDIYGQLLNTNGGEVGDNFIINDDDGVNQQHSPRVAGLSHGGFVVVWYDNREGNDDIYGQRYDNNSEAVGGNFKLNDDDGEKRQAWPKVAADGYGRFYAAWVDWRNGNYPENPDIYFRRYDSSGAPLGVSKRISEAEDDSAPQRDVAICADRMGNLGIVWADSTSGEWNAIGKVVDASGVIDSDFFQMHQYTAGRQRQPDIATDGYKFYFVWADDRSGDFDIYLTIRDYNDPTILASPNALHFNMEENGTLPASQTVSLSNAGYGELNWELRTNVDWIGLSRTSGITPENIAVSITDGNLEYGEYVGEIRVVNLDFNDSTVVIPVSLSVTAPIMKVSPDTVSFRVLAEMGNPLPKEIAIENIGSGTLDWTAVEDINWFEINPASGTAPDYAEIDLDVSGMLYGDYLESFEITSAVSVNPSETVYVSLSLAGNMPFISPSPSPLELHGKPGDILYGAIQINNPGSETLNWQVYTETPWLAPDVSQGSDGDGVNIEATTASFTSGIHTGEIVFYDSASFNVDTTVPVNVYLSSDDTLEIYNANAMIGGIGVMPIRMTLMNPATEIYIPLTYEDDDAILDSIVFDNNAFGEFVSFSYSIRDSLAEIGLSIDASYTGDSVIPSGSYEFARLYFTGGDSDAVCHIDTISSDTASLYVIDESMQKSVPLVMPGRFYIGNPTDVADMSESGNLPEQISLEQNYPNPFNVSTRISFYIPLSGRTELTVYNILGQKVRTLVDDYLDSGRHGFIWDGMLESGVAAPSGIYFARLFSDGTAQVRKMVLLK